MANARSLSTSVLTKLNGSRLKQIISGEAGKPLSNLFSVFASTCSEFCETLFLKIHLKADLEGRTARVEIPGTLKSRAGPKINEFTGEPFPHRDCATNRQFRIHLCGAGIRNHLGDG